MNKKKSILLNCFLNVLQGKSIYVVQRKGESFSMRYEDDCLYIEKEKTKMDFKDVVWLDEGEVL